MTRDRSIAFRALWAALGPAATRRMVSLFQADDAAAYAEALRRLREAFRRLAALLPADGEGGVTPAAIAIGALAAPVVLPPQYCGRLPAELEELYRRDPEARATTDEFRGTPAGQWVLRLYETSRVRSGTPT